MATDAPDQPSSDDATSSARPSTWPVSRRFVLLWVGAAALFGLLAVGEMVGWPWLASPLERVATARLKREVRIDTGEASASVEPAASTTSPAYVRLAAARPTRFSLRFLGALRLEAPRVQVAGPAWGHVRQMLVAHDLAIELRYIDLWHAWRGQALRVERLHVDTVELHLDRLADGRASWHVDPADTPASGSAARAPLGLPYFGHLQVAAGNVGLHDAVAGVDLKARLSLVDAASPLGSPWDASRVRGHGQGLRVPLHVSLPEPLHVRQVGLPEAVASTVAQAGGPGGRPPGPYGQGGPGPGAALRDHSSIRPDSVLQLSATGWFRQLPLRLELLVGGSLPSSGEGTPGAARPVAVNLTGSVGTASLAFDGQVGDARSTNQLSGRFKLRGPSLAAVGDTLGVTLPTTGAFSTEGVVTRKDSLWKVSIGDARIGVSQLAGEFSYEQGVAVPLLRGRLVGARLHLADLGPAIGTSPMLPVSRDLRQPAGRTPTPVVAPGRVLPDRDFDLAALRVMDADVAVSIAEVDLGSGLLEPLRPLRVRLLLQGGVLHLRDIDTRVGAGRLSGDVQLDGRRATALMAARLRWDGVALDHWIHQQRGTGDPPYVSGRLSGNANLKGRGGSTADILASLNGSARTELRGGTVSHLAIELAGLDLATSLGLLITGDDRLPVRCAVADLVAVDGVFRPRMMVVDTRAASIWVGGSLSLANESLDLRAVVSPRDFSPVALRTPLFVRGSLAHPQVTIDRGSIGRKLGTSALLALVNPMAALLPLIEMGSASNSAPEAHADGTQGQGCAGLVVPAALRLARPNVPPSAGADGAPAHTPANAQPASAPQPGSADRQGPLD